jgi:hypothetical protein
MSAFGGFPDRFEENPTAAMTYANFCFPETALGSTWEAAVRTAVVSFEIVDAREASTPRLAVASCADVATLAAS